MFNQKYFEERVNAEIENGKFNHYIKEKSTLALYDVVDGKVIVQTTGNEGRKLHEEDAITEVELDSFIQDVAELLNDTAKFPYIGCYVDTGKHRVELFTGNELKTSVIISESKL